MKLIALFAFVILCIGPLVIVGEAPSAIAMPVIAFLLALSFVGMIGVIATLLSK